MSIIFRKIRYKNFLAVGNDFIETSTLIVALFFVLFNRPYRNVKKNNLVNSINKRNCVVEIEFSVPSGDYKVIRGIKPNIFEIYKDGNVKVSSGILTIGNTTITEEQLQQLLTLIQG